MERATAPLPAWPRGGEGGSPGVSPAPSRIIDNGVVELEGEDEPNPKRIKRGSSCKTAIFGLSETPITQGTLRLSYRSCIKLARAAVTFEATQARGGVRSLEAPSEAAKMPPPFARTLTTANASEQCLRPALMNKGAPGTG